MTSIGPDAFFNCSGFTGDLIIPNSVTTIGTQAFYHCSGFTGNLTIGNSVTSIQENAFSGCTGLTGSLTIPNSVTSIGRYAFYNCQAISFFMSLAETPPTVGQQAFGLWNSNTIVYVPCGFEDAYASLSWGGFSNFHGICGGTVTVAVDPEEGGMVTGGGTFEAGQACTVTATAMEGYAFVKWTLNGLMVSLNTEYNFYVYGDMTLVAHFVQAGNIVFADSTVKEICVSHWDTNGDGELSYVEAALVTSLDLAFRNNTDITSFEELQYFVGLSSISNYAFYNCTALIGSLILPNSLTSIGNYAFNNCSGFTGSLILPNSLTFIGTGAFKECTGFTGSLTIPNSVTTIREYAFYNCSGFTGSLILPNSLTTIGYRAFYNCSGFTGSLTIPNSVTSIDSYVFYNCRGFTGSLTISDSMTSISDGTFYNCSGFTGNLTIPNSVTTIGCSAFRNCRNLTGDLTIPNSVTSIGYDAFYDCRGFTGNLTIPNSVTYISSEVFRNCSGLTGDLTIPSSVTMISYGAFYGCKGFTGDLTIPNSVTSISGYVFYNCSGLTSLTMGNSVTSMGSYAFQGCSKLTSITLHTETPPTIESNTFYNCPKSIPVYVPCGSEASYQAAAYWSEFTDIQEVCTQSQTVTLSEGSNWFSTYVEITLDDLKAALLEALPTAAANTIKIKSQRNGQATWNGRMWTGQLRDMDVAQMYKIIVPTACELAVEGMPIDPAEHPLTIANGANWMGYPLSEGMTVTNAFAGFAVNNDAVKSAANGQANWNGRMWMGTLKNLDPGKGYIYKSNATGSRTFTFPTSAK